MWLLLGGEAKLPTLDPGTCVCQQMEQGSGIPLKSVRNQCRHAVWETGLQNRVKEKGLEGEVCGQGLRVPFMSVKEQPGGQISICPRPEAVLLWTFPRRQPTGTV